MKKILDFAGSDSLTSTNPHLVPCFSEQWAEHQVEDVVTSFSQEIPK